MRKWSETEALDYLFQCEIERIGPRTIIVRGGLNGLKACSAMDYLRKCNFRFRMLKRIKPQKILNTSLEAGVFGVLKVAA